MAANFAVKAMDIAEEIAVKVREMNRTQSEVQLLVQPRIERCVGQVGQGDGRTDLPSSVGITYNIHDI